MKLFIALIRNKPEAEAIRAANIEAHRTFLRKHASRFLIGGAQLGEDETSMYGSAYVFEAESLSAAVAFFAQDPLSIADTREQVTIRPWRQALFDREYVFGTAKAGEGFPS